MQLFYTVISQPDAAQSSPLNSLGGFCSSSPVQSAAFNALFGDASTYTLQKNTPEYVALMLKNTLGRPVKNLKFWIVPDPDPLFTMRIGLSAPNAEGEMEHVANVNSKPLYAEFFQPTADDPFEIDGEFEAGVELGIWIERSLNADSDQVTKVSDCNYLFDLYKENKKLPETEIQSLKISWEEA